MRCIFCNKAIPLLRRLSDSQFCSDEHRAAYANEQNLALQRLMTTQVLGKTQRMAAAVPAETRSAAPAVLTIPDGFKTAGAFQAYILDRPLPFQREWNCHAPLEPGHAVVLMDYAPQLRRRFGRLATTVRIPVPALRRRPRPKRSDDPVWTSRAHLPRTASRALPWTYTKPDAQTDPPFVERLRAVSTPAKRTPGAPVTVRGFESQLTPAAPQLSNAVARRKLPAPSGSFAVPQKVAAPAAVPETRPVLW
ncbi:MAG: hypothetical protein FJW30_22885, partial [Acidobacteria bacterium]|nr:hypothetical protein [Acidobacteriota bacterium]